jgi:hypothetical protein
VRHIRDVSSPSPGLEAPPWPGVRRGRHFLDALPAEEVSPLSVKPGCHFADPGLRVEPDSRGEPERPDKWALQPGPLGWADPAAADQPASRTWLEGVVAELPAPLLEVVAAAVDPLEIAASLETCGLSNAVVHDRFGHTDTFRLAEQLYSGVEFRAAGATAIGPNRPGGVPDLGRGLVFAAPTLMFAGAAIALRSGLSWWTAPLALMCGWAFSQFVAYLGFSREAVGEPPGAAVVWGLLGALVTCGIVGLIGAVVLGGTYVDIVFVAAACAFATSAAALVVRAQERLMGLLIIPGAAASLIFIISEPFALPSPIVLVLVAGSTAGTVVAALTHLPALWWRLPAVTRAEAPSAACAFANGCCCGLFLSILVVLQPADNGLHNWPGVVAYPMILSLGVMEWQVRSLRSGTRRALCSVYTVAEFPALVQRKLARATLLYLGALVFLTAVVRVLALAHGVAVPTSLLAAGSCLSLAFFLALVVTSYGRIDLVLRVWLAALAVYGVLGLSAVVTRPGWPAGATELALLIAAAAAAVGLVLTARHVVLDPLCHG